ncbi:MAG: hypothetical protein U0637_15835 [Phycisphaerales bacterium]
MSSTRLFVTATALLLAFAIIVVIAAVVGAALGHMDTGAEVGAIIAAAGGLIFMFTANSGRACHFSRRAHQHAHHRARHHAR